MSISGTYVFRLLGFSLHHHDEKDSAFVPAAAPAHPPIIDMIAKRHRLAKPKELGLNVHGSVHTHPWLGWSGQSTGFVEREQARATIKNDKTDRANLTAECPSSRRPMSERMDFEIVVRTITIRQLHSARKNSKEH
jgi:hypothetical protein